MVAFLLLRILIVPVLTVPAALGMGWGAGLDALAPPMVVLVTHGIFAALLLPFLMVAERMPAMGKTMLFGCVLAAGTWLCMMWRYRWDVIFSEATVAYLIAAMLDILLVRGFHVSDEW